MIPMLEVSMLSVRYGLSQILQDINLHIKTADIVTLLGRNGMGKTTTLRTIMGLAKAHQGRITFDNQRIDQLPSWKIAQLGIGYVPEGRQIFPNLTVRENLIATSRSNHARTWDESKIYSLFPRLAERKQNMGNELSGGEQQMLAIGRALMTNPRLLILDEATEGLAPVVRAQIWKAIQRLKATGLSILLVDKSLAEMRAVMDRAVILERGESVWEGAPAEIDASVAERYLGV